LARKDGTTNATAPATTSTAKMINAVVASPLSWSWLTDRPRSTSETKNTRRNKTTCVTNSDTESITPAESAVADDTPNRWKKRVVRAIRPAELGTARLT
jgi:hypothetical protein